MCRRTSSAVWTGDRGTYGRADRVCPIATDGQNLATHRALGELGVDPARVSVHHGLTGTIANNPGLRQALAACRAGDTWVVTKLDRLARCLPDARAIADELSTSQVKVKVKLGASVHDPTDPVGRHRGAGREGC